jgi:hypothetical protein
MFFSEEKNQKTFDLAPASRYGIWPDRWGGGKSEGLVVLFFAQRTYFLL